MKHLITLTKTLALAVLLVTFTTAAASVIDGDKCKTKCCKEKKEKSLEAVLIELEKEMDQLEAELNTLTSAIVKTQVKQSLQKLRPLRIISTQVVAFAPAATAETATVEAKHKINFNELNKEMDTVQESMTAAPDQSQKIDFCNIENEMNKVQEDLSRIDR